MEQVERSSGSIADDCYQTLKLWIIMIVNLYVEVRDETHRSEMEHKLREAAAFYDATQFDPLLARENPCLTLEEVEAELELK